MVTFDDTGDIVFGIDAGAPSKVLVIASKTGKVLNDIAMPTRVRRLVLHPTLPIAYAVYEKDGQVAVWSWPKEWNSHDGTPRTPPEEVQKVTTSPDEVSFPEIVNIPTNFAITADGKFGYSTTRTALFAHGGSGPTAKIGVFAIDPGSGTLTLKEWVDSGSWNIRDSILSPNDSALITVDVLGHLVTSFARDPSTGLLTKASTVSATSPTSVVCAWMPSSSSTTTKNQD